MAKWKCNMCGYLYDEDTEGTAFEDLPEDYKCPMCGASKSMFSKAEQEVLNMAFVCKVCGYVHEADELPEDFTCPMCGVPASNFEEQ